MSDNQRIDFARDLVVGTLWFLIAAGLVPGLIGGIFAFVESGFSLIVLIEGLVEGFRILTFQSALIIGIIVGLIAAFFGLNFRNKKVVPIIMGAGFGIALTVFYTISSFFMN